MAKFVVYQSRDEVIVMSKKKEDLLIRQYFKSDYDYCEARFSCPGFTGDRDIEDYTREETNNLIISANLIEKNY